MHTLDSILFTLFYVKQGIHAYVFFNNKNMVIIGTLTHYSTRFEPKTEKKKCMEPSEAPCPKTNFNSTVNFPIISSNYLQKMFRFSGGGLEPRSLEYEHCVLPTRSYVSQEEKKKIYYFLNNSVLYFDNGHC